MDLSRHTRRQFRRNLDNEILSPPGAKLRLKYGELPLL